MEITPVVHKAPLKSLDEKMNDLPFGAMEQPEQEYTSGLLSVLVFIV